MHNLIKSFFLAMVLILATPQSEAQEIDEVNAVLQNVGSWGQSYSQAVSLILPLYINEHLDIAIEAIENEDDEALNKAAKAYSDHRRQILSDMKKSLANIPPVPEIDILGSQGKNMENALHVQLKQLDEIYKEAAQSSGHLDTYLNRTAKSEFDGIGTIHNEQLKASIRMIEAENVQIDAAMIAIPKDHPNFNLQKVMKAQNLFVIEELRISMISYEDLIYLEERMPHVKEMKKHLKVMEENISKAKKNLRKSTGEMEMLKKMTNKPDEIAFVEKILTAMASFTPQIDLERKNYLVYKDSYEAYSSDGSDVDYAERIEANDEKIQNYDLQIAEMMDARLGILAE